MKKPVDPIEKYHRDARAENDRISQVAREFARVLVAEAERGVDSTGRSGEERVAAADRDAGYMDRHFDRMVEDHKTENGLAGH